ncbi:phasin family protein [Thalassospira alkalitolerans]|uniref:phasin family protein n=1 Tax=Thalassospira alkalitolerans TaxID=1293890 RepID=UPI003AA9D577
MAEVSVTPTTPPKRVVTTAAALEADATRQVPAAPAAPSLGAKTDGGAVKAQAAPKPVAASSEAEPKSAPPAATTLAVTPIDDTPAANADAAKVPEGKAAKDKPATASKPAKATDKPVVVEAKSPVVAKVSPPAKKAPIVTQEQKTVAAPKAAAASKPAPAKVEAKPVADTAAESKASNTNDVMGFGAMSFEPLSLEPFFDLWKTPDVDAMMSASKEAFEGSVTAANDSIAQFFDTFSGQADVFSDAGTKVIAQYEEFLGGPQKGLESVLELSSAMMEKSSSLGAELVSWAQSEIDASQADLEALSKIESLSELQDLNSRIFKRYVETGMSEGEKIQEMMLSAINESVAAMTKVAGAPMK